MAIQTQSLNITPFSLPAAQAQRNRNRLADQRVTEMQNFNARAPQRNALADLVFEQETMKTGALKTEMSDRKLYREGVQVKNALNLAMKDPSLYPVIRQRLAKRGHAIEMLPEQFEIDRIRQILAVTEMELPKVAAKLQKVGRNDRLVDAQGNTVVDALPPEVKRSALYQNLVDAGLTPGTSQFKAAMLQGIQRSGGAGGQVPSKIQVFEYREKLDPAARRRFDASVRANRPIDTGSQLIYINPETLEPIRVVEKTLTPAQEPAYQAEVEGAKATAKAGVSIVTAAQERGVKSEQALAALESVDELIEQSTGSWGGAALDMVASGFGYAPEGAIAVGKLKVLQANIMLSQPRMEGPQSDKDVNLYREAAGQIGDPTVPNAIKKAAVETIRSLHRKYAPEGGGNATQSTDFSGMTEDEADAAYDALPSGATFTDPEGVQRRKP